MRGQGGRRVTAPSLSALLSTPQCERRCRPSENASSLGSTPSFGAHSCQPERYERKTFDAVVCVPVGGTHVPCIPVA